jgi:hypothetical protein
VPCASKTKQEHVQKLKRIALSSAMIEDDHKTKTLQQWAVITTNRHSIKIESLN